MIDVSFLTDARYASVVVGFLFDFFFHVFIDWLLCLSSILGSSPVPHSPLEVGLGVSLDKGVDWSNPALGSVVWCRMVGSRGRGTIWRGISSHSVGNTVLPVIKDENPASRCTGDKGKEEKRGDSCWSHG